MGQEHGAGWGRGSGIENLSSRVDLFIVKMLKPIFQPQ